MLTAGYTRASDTARFNADGAYMNYDQKRFLGIAVLATVGLLGCSRLGGVDAKSREPLTSYLKDPESARFRNERTTKSGAICGEVNSKNSMGGYVGFKRYILAGPGSNYLEDSGALGEWSLEDLREIKSGASALWLQVADYNNKHRVLPMDMPSESAREAMIEAELFEKKWKQLCGTAKS